uniref:Uncharacterized protein LOC100366745 n=1 Tax=Saccoglossus kowalevskii TaxID=10224 RepID=A0ABM0M2A3_SACKO|nr:PREDICTED: uncharacterized protein LOC100366745 [Saccoglossus kowalevskii]
MNTTIESKHGVRRAARELFFNNLLLLGFEATREEAKHRIPFTSEMFALPNKKGFEVVTHFLFEKLNPAMAAEQFRDCWPVADKKQEQQFRKTVSNWIQHIAKECPEANLPRIVPSMFLSPGGDKFYNLLMHFSTFVCMKLITDEHGMKPRQFLQRPKLMPSYSHLGIPIVKSLHCGAIRHRKKFLEKLQSSAVLQKEWQEVSNDFVKNHRVLKKQIRELDRKVEDMRQKNHELNHKAGSPVPMRRRSGGRFEGEMEVEAIKRAQRIQKVRELWNSIEDFHGNHSHHREVLDSVLNGLANKHMIDASDIIIQRNIGNTYEGGKLNLLTILHLYNLSLHLYIEKLQQTVMPQFKELNPKIATEFHIHHAHLVNTQALKSKLAFEMIPELKESIDTIIAELDDESTARDQKPDDSLSGGLQLIPPTPPSSYELRPNSDIETPPHLRAAWSMSRGSPMPDTPEAVARLDETMTRIAMRRVGLVQGTPTSTRKEIRDQLKGDSRPSKKSEIPRPIVVPTMEKTMLSDSMMTEASYMSNGAASFSKYSEPSTRHHITASTLAHQPRAVRMGEQPRAGLSHQPRLSGPAHQKRASGLISHEKSASRATQPQRNSSSKTSVRQETHHVSFDNSMLQHETTPKAYDLLAEQIADALVGNTPDDEKTPPLAVVDPLKSLGLDAFVSRSKLNRTPDAKTNDLSRAFVLEPESVACHGKHLFTEHSEEEEEEEGEKEEKQQGEAEEENLREEKKDGTKDAFYSLEARPVDETHRIDTCDVSHENGNAVLGAPKMNINESHGDDSDKMSIDLMDFTSGETVEENDKMAAFDNVQDSIEGLQEIETDDMFLGETPQLPTRSMQRIIPSAPDTLEDKDDEKQVEDLSGITMPTNLLTFLDEDEGNIDEPKEEEEFVKQSSIMSHDNQINGEAISHKGMEHSSEKSVLTLNGQQETTHWRQTCDESMMSVAFSESDEEPRFEPLNDASQVEDASISRQNGQDSHISSDIIERFKRLKASSVTSGSPSDPLNIRDVGLGDRLVEIKLQSVSSDTSTPAISSAYLTQSPKPKSENASNVFSLDLDDSDLDVSGDDLPLHSTDPPEDGISEEQITLVDISLVSSPMKTPKLQKAHVTLMSAHMSDEKGRGIDTEVIITPPTSAQQSPRQTPTQRSPPARLVEQDSKSSQSGSVTPSPKITNGEAARTTPPPLTQKEGSIPMSPLTLKLHSDDDDGAANLGDEKAEFDIFGLGNQSVLIPPSPGEDQSRGSSSSQSPRMEELE